MVILADNQAITAAGLKYLLGEYGERTPIAVRNKAELSRQLEVYPEASVICDYTLFDFSDISDLLIMLQRFSQSHWLLFSEDLSIGFVKQIVASVPHVGILLKDSNLEEINQALDYTVRRKRYICQHIMELLLNPEPDNKEKVHLTKTETEILRDIALGMTTKEIAEKRFSSFHTINTHRKNIFRKIAVNNVHEATKYAFRSGLVDAAEYYI